MTNTKPTETDPNCSHYVCLDNSRLLLSELESSAHDITGFRCCNCGATGILNIDPDEIEWR